MTGLLQAFGVAIGIVFVAELGDKSQLLTLTFAARYRWQVVLLGVSIATALLMGLSVTVGQLVAGVVPQRTLEVIAGVIFLAFAAWTLWGHDDDDDEDDAKNTSRGALPTIIGAFALAELGDKTMLTAITLAATGNALGTWLGATLGMIGANGLALLLGDQIGKQISERALRLTAGALFAVFGFLLLFGIGPG